MNDGELAHFRPYARAVRTCECYELRAVHQRD